MNPARPGARLALLLLLAGVPAGADPGGMCESGGPGPVSGSVALVVVASAERVASYSATVRGVEVLRRDAETVIFADGRAITSDVAAAGRHLNALGWGSRKVQIVASLPARARRRPG